MSIQAIQDQANELISYLRVCEARVRATADEAEQLAILSEALNFLSAEAVRAHAKAIVLAERVTELERESMLPQF